MDAENGFLIAGKVYEVPTLDSLTLDEAEVMYGLCETAQEDFVQEAGETDEEHQQRVGKLTRRPGFMGALAQIAYQRGNPSVKPGQARLVLGKTNRLEMFSSLAPAEEEEPDVPLALTSEPSERSPSGSPESESSTGDSSGSGGNGSGNGSDDRDGEAVTTTISRSAISSTWPPGSLAGSPSGT